MNEADIVIATFPQSDGSLKRRPALILREMPPFRDFLICGISTQIRQKIVKLFAEFGVDAKTKSPYI